MKSNLETRSQTTAQLGELVVAAFDKAGDYSANQREVAQMATRVVIHMLRHMRWARRPQGRLRVIREAKRPPEE
jgi:hypothetical protein